MDISTGFDVFERSDPFEDIDPFAEFNERLNRIHLEAPPGSKFDFFHNIKLGIFHPAPSDMADKAMVAGDKALEKGEVLQSIYWYTLALNHEPSAPAAYILRSIAYTRLKPEHGGPKYQAAMEDAEVALVLASDRGRREYYLASQFRRAICLYQFGRLGDAAWLLQRLDDSIKKEESSPSPSAKFNFRRPISLWAVKLKVLGAKKTEGDPKWDVTVPEVNRSVYMPSVEVLKAQLESAKAALSPAQNVVTPDKTYSAPLYTYTDCSEEPGKAPEKESDKFSIREEWYQTRFEVVVNLFVQPMKFDGTKIEVKFTEMDVEYGFPDLLDEPYKVTIPLLNEIIPERSSWSAKNHKLELKLRKTASYHWSGLNREFTGLRKFSDPKDILGKPDQDSKPSAPAKDWDKVIADIKEAEATEANKASGKSKDAKLDDSDSEGDDVDSFFKKLYRGADADTRRAMIKSYTESQGTSLSTNWTDVSKDTVQPHE